MTFERIKEMVQQSPYLVADTKTGDVRLVDEPTAFRTMRQEEPFPNHAVLRLDRGIDKFAALDVIGREDREFSLREVAGIAGMTYHNCYQFMAKRILVPSIRPADGSGTGQSEAIFSWSDAWSAGIVGTLRRLGLKPDLMRKVQPLFTTETKRTAQQLTPAERS